MICTYTRSGRKRNYHIRVDFLNWLFSKAPNMLFFPTFPPQELCYPATGLQRYIFFQDMLCSGLCISSYLSIYSPFKIKRFADKVITVGCTSCCYYQCTITEYSSRYALSGLYALAPCQHQLRYPPADDARFK